MTYPPSSPASPEPPRASQPVPTRSRRRRRGQLVIPVDAEGRAALLTALARRAYPSYELFVFAVLCGAILGFGYFLDSQALLIFGILVAPLMTPWIGLLLGAITGSARFLFETFMALVISSILIFLSGLLAGLAVRPFLPRTLNEAFIHSRLWWPDLVVLAIGAIILTISFVRSEEKPYLPSVMLAYELFLPLSAGGFGLSSGIANIWPQGLMVFFVHFAWATLFGLLTLAALRFTPRTIGGFVFSIGTGLILAAVLVFLMIGGSWASTFAPQTPPPTALVALNPSPSATLVLVPEPATSSILDVSSTPLIETLTPVTPAEAMTPSPVPLTLEVTLPPSETPTVTLTFEPTPVYARIHATIGGGAYLRKDPNGKYLATLDNDSIVEVLPDTQEVSGVTWAHVVAIKNGLRMDGWLLQDVLEVATPVPNWQPSSTPTLTPSDTATATPTQ